MNANEHELQTLRKMTGFEVTVTMQDGAVLEGLCVRSVAHVVGSTDKYMLVVDDEDNRPLAIWLDLIGTVHAD